MHLQGALLDEALAAGVAAEGPLPGVDPLVAFQSVGLVEAFAASVAPERLLPRVYAQVSLQVTLYCEALVAVLAYVGPLPCVDHLVHLQAVGSVEALPALLTAKRPDVGVESLVVPQQMLQGETFTTHITGVGSLACRWRQRSIVTAEPINMRNTEFPPSSAGVVTSVCLCSCVSPVWSSVCALRLRWNEKPRPH